MKVGIISYLPHLLCADMESLKNNHYYYHDYMTIVIYLHKAYLNMIIIMVIVCFIVHSLACGPLAHSTVRTNGPVWSLHGISLFIYVIKIILYIFSFVWSTQKSHIWHNGHKGTWDRRMGGKYFKDNWVVTRFIWDCFELLCMKMYTMI